MDGLFFTGCVADVTMSLGIKSHGEATVFMERLVSIRFKDGGSCGEPARYIRRLEG